MDIGKYVTIDEKEKEWGITKQTIWRHLKNKRIKGAIKRGNCWLIPQDAEKPKDRRYNYNK